MSEKVLIEAVNHFPLDGAVVAIERYGCGHINVTWLVVTETGRRYILQKLSPAFKDPDGLMENITSVTRFLAERAADPRETMTVICTDTGESLYKDETGAYRMYAFVEGTICLQKAETPEDFYQSAVGFGRFQQLLSEFPAETLHESIPNFHNTVDRYRIFHEVLEKDPVGRAKDVQPEIEFALSYEQEGGILCRMLANGELPLRVTHNDTKLNNVLLDEATRKALCVIDLDTVMPGLSLYDFGDSIRFGAATAAEDETDLSKMTCDLDLFRIFTRGFLQECRSLTDKEIEMLPMGAKIMTLECGVRFLTDYLDGDHYFAVHKEGHNLLRARTQFRLVQEMDRKWAELAQIIREEKAAVSMKTE